jgi:glutathione S-transferase
LFIFGTLVLFGDGVSGRWQCALKRAEISASVAFIQQVAGGLRAGPRAREPKMKIIEQERAPNPRRVRIFLAEKGIEVEREQISLADMQHKAPEFVSLNPFKSVPVLVLDDGTVLAETMAICRYFEELQPEPRLMGESALEKATIEMWSRRMELQLFYPIVQCFRHLHPAMAELEQPQVADWGEANRPRVLWALQILDDVLADRAFVVGDTFSVADINAMVAIDFMKPARIERPAELKALARWYDEVSSRPSAKA